MNLSSLACLLTLLVFARSAFSTPIAVHSGSLVMNLDANAFATGVHPSFYPGYGITMTPGQPHIVLGRYFSLEDMVGRKLVGNGARPDLNGMRPVSNVGTAAAPVWSVDIRQFRSTYNAAPTRTTGLLFNVYDTAPPPADGFRNPVSTDFTIDSNGSPATANGVIGFGGGMSFLYSNDAFLSYPNSGRYIALGDFHLQYETPPAAGYTGWVFYSNVMGTTPIFLTKNVVVTVNGSDVSISGDLYAAGDLVSFTAMIDTLQIGTFSFSTVPVTHRESWRKAYFGTTANTGSSADSADPNGNGSSNLLDYALHADPADSNPGRTLPLQTSLSSGGKLQTTFSCARSRPDLTLKVQAADSLSGPWTDLAQSAAGATFSVVTPGAVVSEMLIGDIRQITVTDLYSTTDPAHAARFIRLQVFTP
jgi:hypothetical protein